MVFKQIIQALRPEAIRKAIRRNRLKSSLKKYGHLTTEEIFSKIYKNHLWGKAADPSFIYYSGSGSHGKRVVSSYVEAMENYLSSFPQKPDVVDLGCGDFYVGSAIRRCCGSYVGCDIVAELIELNKDRYKHQDVDFRVLDISRDPLPKADVAIVRQVFQHLSNDLIAEAVAKIARSYKYLVLTEILPASETFVPNLDKPTGDHTRLLIDSGIVLTESPFKLKAIDQHVLCEVRDMGGVIRTVAYSLAGE